MPCNCDHMEPTYREAKLGHIRSLLDELSGLFFNHAKSSMHRSVYNEGISDEVADSWISDLCKRCTTLEVRGELMSWSLELQIWWRDHKIEDAKKAAEIKEVLHKIKARNTVIDKLTAEERKVLGV